MKKRKRTPEEVERSRDLRRRTLERLLDHEQRRENAIAQHEGREPRRVTPEMLPSLDEVHRMMRERIAQYERLENQGDV
jgi:hypothetical protein